MFFRTLLGLDDGILGRIMVIHTFGDCARCHPHLHAIVGDGLFRPNGTFYCLPQKGPEGVGRDFPLQGPKNFEVFSAEEFGVAITQHIPDRSFQMVRYGACPELVEGAGTQAEVEEKESRLGSSDPVMSRRLPRAIPRQPCSMCPSTNLGGFRPRPGGNSSRKYGKWTLSAVPDAAAK